MTRIGNSSIKKPRGRCPPTPPSKFSNKCSRTKNAQTFVPFHTTTSHPHNTKRAFNLFTTAPNDPGFNQNWEKVVRVGLIGCHRGKWMKEGEKGGLLLTSGQILFSPIWNSRNFPAQKLKLHKRFFAQFFSQSLIFPPSVFASD